MLVSGPAFAQSSCVAEGSFQSCSGDQSGGISATSPVEALQVGDLSADIAPATGTVGILYETDTAATLLSDTGGFGITTEGADGIRVGTTGGDVYIRQTGDVTATGGRGIFAFSDNGGAVIEGAGAVSAEGDAISASPKAGPVALKWSGAITSSAGLGIALRADNGAPSAEGTGNISGALGAVRLSSAGSGGNTSLKWSGDISAAAGAAVSLDATDGGASVEGEGAVASGGSGFTVDARGPGGNASLRWDGAITADGGHAVLVYSANGGADARGSGDIAALGFGIAVETDSTAQSASVNWEGAISSQEASGIVVSAASGGASVSGGGTVAAAFNGISVSSTGNASAVVSWNGDVTGRSREGILAYSAGGAASVTGSGTVSGNTDAIHIETDGAATASLDWVGDIRSGGANGVHITSALGAVSSNTQGLLESQGGGVYARSGSNNTAHSVTVSHQGNLTAEGVGVEARSPVAAVAVKVEGDMQTGSNAIYAESRGAATVSVEQTGSLTAGNTGIYAYSSNGAVSVKQSGALSAYGTGIAAVNEGPGTVFVGKTGSIAAVTHGITAQSATGDVAVRMTDGTITAAGGSGILAANAGAGTVTVEMTGAVTAAQDGVKASSANGQVFVNVIGAVEAAGDGVTALNIGSGEVGVTQTGDVTAGGDGLVAASATGNATVTVASGTIRAAANGIRLTGFGNLSANIAEGVTVTGGAAGVLLDGGLSNTITNFGTIAHSSGLNHYAILSEKSDTLVQNHGTVSGNVRLGPWSNAFNNLQGARLDSGTVLDVGAGNTVTNAGILSPGGDGVVGLTQLTGNLVTTETSRLAFDIDMAGDGGDKIAVSGTAALAGDLVLSFTSVSAVPRSFEFITTEGGVLSQGLSLVSNAFVAGEIATSLDGSAVTLNLSGMDLSANGLSESSSEIGAYFNRAFAAGGAGTEEFVAMLVSDGTLEGGEAIYDALRPDVVMDTVSGSHLQAQTFADGMMSCPVSSGLSAPTREADCAWTRLDASRLQRGSAGTGLARTETFTLTQGVQRAIDQGDWHLGGAMGISFSNTRKSNGDSVETNRVHAGVTLKYAPGAFQFVTALSGSWGSVSSERRVSVGGSTQTLSGATDVGTYNLKLRGAYLFGSDSLYVMPQVDFNTTYITSNAYRETGGSAALAIDGMNETIFSLVPAVEIGTHRRSADGDVLRAFARLGASFYSQGGVDVTSALASDTTGVNGFTLGTGNDSKVWNLSAGFTAYQAAGWSVEGRVGLTRGGDTKDQHASIKLRRAF